MRKVIVSILILVIFGVQSTIFAKPIKRIYFKKGAVSTVAVGTLRNYRDSQNFVIKVRKGQTLQTEQLKSDSSASYVTVAIKDPRGRYVGDDSDLSCHSRKEISPTMSGDYTIEVKECGKADAWRGSFNLKVSVR